MCGSHLHPHPTGPDLVGYLHVTPREDKKHSVSPDEKQKQFEENVSFFTMEMSKQRVPRCDLLYRDAVH